MNFRVACQAMIGLALFAGASVQAQEVAIPEGQFESWRDDYLRLLACEVEELKTGTASITDIERSGSRVLASTPGGFVDVDCEETALPIFLQATHQYRDLHTGEIADRLWDELPLAVAARNRIHRDAFPGADLSDQPDSWLLAMTEAFFDHYPRGVVVQLHGFSNDFRTEVAARRARFIVSPGVRQPSRRHQRLADCLWTSFKPVLLFPSDTGELGGTLNVIGRRVNARRPGHFFHIEMNEYTRDQLSSGDQIDALARCIGEVAER